MTLTLTIENVSVLPDGGPLSIAVSGRRGIDIGRDQYLDWTLPDPDRAISGKHAEIRYRDGSYWLQDVSRNGTYLNRNPQRLQEAYRLKEGDRIEIGHYVIRVRIEGVAAAADPSPDAAVAPEDVWEAAGEVPPPIPSRDLRPPASRRPVRPDFIDWAVDLPAGPLPAQSRPAQDPGMDRGVDRGLDRAMDWAQATPDPPVTPLPPMPTPRRPVTAPDSVPPPPAGPEGTPWQTPAAETGPWGTVEHRIANPHPDRALPTPVEARRPNEAAAPAGAASSGDAFLHRFAAGLGIPPETLSWREPGDLAEEAGHLLRLSAESLKQLLAARTEAKLAARTANQTTVQALDNNPLKFAPSVDDALRIMLGRPSSGYLDARRAMEAGFRDVKTHQVKTYAAMQSALRLLLEELSPDSIEASDEKDRGLGGLLGSRKARLWDIYATRWNALTTAHEEGMVDAFLIFFADCYDGNR